MVELSCLADLSWIGGALRTGGPDGAVFAPVLRAYLRLAGDSLRGFLNDSPGRRPAEGDVPCA